MAVESLDFLEEKIKKAVNMISRLKEEKELLKIQNSQMQARLNESMESLELLEEEGQDATLLKEKLELLKKQNEEILSTLGEREEEVRGLTGENAKLKNLVDENDLLKRDKETIENRVEDMLSQLENLVL